MDLLVGIVITALWFAIGFSAWWAAMTKYHVWNCASGYDYFMGGVSAALGPIAWFVFGLLVLCG